MYSHCENDPSLILDRDGHLHAVVVQGRRQLLAVTAGKAGQKSTPPDQNAVKTLEVELFLTPCRRHVDLDKFLHIFRIGLELDLEAFLQI